MLELNNFYNMDCMEGMKQFPDNYFELAIVDPPYRNTNQPTKDMRRNSTRFCKNEFLGKKPTEEYFSELFRVSQNQIIWGANNFSLPNYKGFVVWKKKSIGENFTMSMAEIAYISEGLLNGKRKEFDLAIETISKYREFEETEIAYLSENLSTISKIFEYSPQGTKEDPRIHPTQKPIELYKWLLNNYAKQGDKILDTHVGSASSLIACHEYGFDYIGFELDKEYFDKATERLNAHKSQISFEDYLKG